MRKIHQQHVYCDVFLMYFAYSNGSRHNTATTRVYPPLFLGSSNEEYCYCYCRVILSYLSVCSFPARVTQHFFFLYHFFPSNFRTPVYWSRTKVTQS